MNVYNRYCQVPLVEQQYIVGRGTEMDSLKFKGYCAEHGIKQVDLAELLGITVSNLNEKINGKQQFTLSQVKTICEKYHISADEYFL